MRTVRWTHQQWLDLLNKLYSGGYDVCDVMGENSQELFETGSVRMTWGGKEFVVEVCVSQVFQ